MEVSQKRYGHGLLFYRGGAGGGTPHVRPAHPAGVLRGWRGIAQCLHPEKHFSFDAPLLVCRGERDRTGTIARHMEDWKRAWPETETAVLPGAAHVVNLDAPEAFNRLLLDFLTRCGGSRRGRR